MSPEFSISGLGSEDEPPGIYLDMKLATLVGKNHEYQMPGLCGPAVVREILKSAREYQLQMGLITQGENDGAPIPDQREIAFEIMSGPIEQDYWSVISPYVSPEDYEFYKTVGLRAYCLPEDMTRYLGSGAVFKENQAIADLKQAVFIDKRPVAVLWNEIIPDRHGTREGGHWSLAVDYNAVNNTFTMIDSSLAERFYDEKGFVVAYVPNRKNTYWTVRNRYKIDASYLTQNWYDKAIIDGKEREYRGTRIVLDLARIKPPKLAHA